MAKSSASQRDGLVGGQRQAGELVGGEQAQRGLEPTRADVGLLALDRDLDRAGLQGAHHVHRDPRRQDGDAVGPPGHLELDADGELEVGAGELEPVPFELEADPGEHWQGTAAVRHCPSGGTEGFDEHITLGSELHGCSLSPCRSCKKIWWW